MEGIYNTVIVKDIEERQKRKETDPNKRKIADIALLKAIARYLAGTIGSPVSLKSITNCLTSNNRKVSPTTVSDYVEALCESFIFYPVQRFDIVGKQLLQTGGKWYMVNEETFQREMKPLAAIKDNYEKIVLTLDKLTPGNYNGIKVIHALDWLME